MENGLLCPTREMETIMDDVPTHLDNSGKGTFSNIAGNIHNPFKRHDPTAYIKLRRPTEDKLVQLSEEVVDITLEEL